MRLLLSGLAAVSALALLAGCDPAPAGTEAMNGGTTPTANTAASTNATENAPTPVATEDSNASGMTDSAVPVSPSGTMSTGAMPKPGDEVAVLDTAQGRIVFEFLTKKAPRMSANFKKLAAKGFYDNTAFHRVIPGFMIQGGDPNSDPKREKGPVGTGGPGYAVKDEFNDTKHVPGVVSMASSGPDTAGSQFFICVGDASYLDGKYSAFGRVVSGQNVADKIAALSRDSSDKPTAIDQARVKSVRIVKWPVK